MGRKRRKCKIAQAQMFMILFMTMATRKQKSHLCDNAMLNHREVVKDPRREVYSLRFIFHPPNTWQG